MNISLKSYMVVRKSTRPPVNEEWDGGYWSNVPAIRIDNFHSQSSSHRPATFCKLTHCEDVIDVFFLVEDRYVRSVNTIFNSPVCQDSCVEFFVQPHAPGNAYFNFEINAGGTLHLSRIEYQPDNFCGAKKVVPVEPVWAESFNICHSMPKIIEPEIIGPITWTLKYCIPVYFFDELLTLSTGTLGGQKWRANFFKCGSNTSHPHWAAWSDIGENLSFHNPDKFGEIIFE